MVGINSGNKDTLQVKYLCPICNLLLRNPVQLLCGHRLCQSCTGDTNKMVIKCTKCLEETPKSEAFDDRGMKNDMRLLNIICSHCQWTGVFGNYQDHLTLRHLNIVILQIQRSLEIRMESLRSIRSAFQQILHDTLPYQTSIEEQNLPGEILQQHHDLFVSNNGSILQSNFSLPSFCFLDGIQSVITSPPFYTSPHGYKMCVRVYLHGNGDGKSTHISVFLILMRGDYDTLLDWPFDFQVIFKLYDLVNQKDHIIESFQTDGNSRCFQRPGGQTNSGAGLSKFILLSKIQQNNNPYVCEDSIYIKAMIRKNPIPISILSYVMDINIALPVDMQEKMIENEIERSQMQSLKLHFKLKPQQLR